MIPKLICHLLCGLITLYQIFISPFLPRSCKYHMTCSLYAKKAIIDYGMQGIVVALIRIMKCHPWS